MKKMMIAAILIFAQLSFAANTREVTRMNKEQAQTRVENSDIFKKMESLTNSKKSIMDDPQLVKRINQMLELTLKGVVEVNYTKVINLLNVDAKPVLTEIARLASIAKDKNSNPQEIEISKKAIELLVVSSENINTTARTTAEANAQKEHLALAVEMSDKVAHFNYNPAAKEFQKAYEAALDSGKTVKEAIKIAGKEKIKEEDLRKCDI